jgi:hypothetical protein
MAVRPIPDEHHVVPHCKKRATIRENGQLIGVYPEAFLLRPANPPLRPKPEDYLSCNYYEHFLGTAAEMMKSSCLALSFQPKPLDAMARLNVGRIKECFKKHSVSVRVTHEQNRGSLLMQLSGQARSTILLRDCFRPLPLWSSLALSMH